MITPLCTVLWELFHPSSVEDQLLGQEHREQAMHDRVTMQAKRAARRVPAQVDGVAVIGVVVKHQITCMPEFSPRRLVE